MHLAPPPVIGPPRDDGSHEISRVHCVRELCARARAEIAENWIFSKISKFDRETNLTILVSFPSDTLTRRLTGTLYI